LVSLTPHADAARQVMEQARNGPVPTDPSTRRAHLLTIKLLEKVSIHVSRAQDEGRDERESLGEVTSAMCNALYSLAVSQTGKETGDETELLCNQLWNSIGAKLQRAIAGSVNKIGSHSVDVPDHKPGRA
jgi:hypothetical protein